MRRFNAGACSSEKAPLACRSSTPFREGVRPSASGSGRGESVDLAVFALIGTEVESVAMRIAQAASHSRR
jgi:hypothetical protein